MNIQVLFFAFFRERTGLSEHPLELPEGAKVTDAIEALEDEYPSILQMRGKFRVARNQEMVDLSESLEDGDELALIPPVAGGMDVQYAKVLDAPLSLDRVSSAVSGPSMGGIVTFTGQVREQNLGHQVVRLDYEAYVDMAESVLSRLCQRIESEFDGVRVAVEHRVGSLAIGDAAVVIAAAAPHRAEAFSACRQLIDALKEEAPIWKKEFSPDGSEWIGMGP